MIEICGLTKRFGKVNAVDNMTVNIPNGAVVGLVGSNGSGKSTLLRMLAGVYAPDGGTVKVDGIQHFDNPVTKGECFLYLTSHILQYKYGREYGFSLQTTLSELERTGI